MKLKKLLTIVSLYTFTSSLSCGATIAFDLEGMGGSGLLTSNEVGGASGTGSGDEIGPGISFDDVTKILTINVGWGTGNGFSDLTGTVTAAHLHGPATQTTNGGIILNLASGLDSSATSGGIVFSSALSAADESNLLSGFTYINVHTGANGGGELRGNLVTVPEPSSALLLGLGALGFVVRRRKIS